jgi:hypothetical protein
MQKVKGKEKKKTKQALKKLKLDFKKFIRFLDYAKL